MNLEPLDDRLVIQPKNVKGDAMSKGGIVIVEAARERPAEGTVVAVGPGRHHPSATGRVPLAVKVGDVVLYGKYSGVEVTHEGQSLLIVREADILARVPK